MKYEKYYQIIERENFSPRNSLTDVGQTNHPIFQEQSLWDWRVIFAKKPLLVKILNFKIIGKWPFSKFWCLRPYEKIAAGSKMAAPIYFIFPKQIKLLNFAVCSTHHSYFYLYFFFCLDQGSNLEPLVYRTSALTNSAIEEFIVRKRTTPTLLTQPLPSC